MTIPNFERVKVNVKGENWSSWLNLTILIIVLINSTLACVILLRNGYLVQSNNILLERVLVRVESLDVHRPAVPVPALYQPAPEFEKMIQLRECPPCPTEPTVTVIPNKDPVSVLHTLVGQDALYEFAYRCENPHHHTSKLTIEDYEGSWAGSGRNRVTAKQQAAYHAIKQHFPEYLSGLTYEDVVYNPICNDAVPSP